MEIGIVLNALVETLEWVIEVGLFHGASDDGIEADLHTIVDLLIIVLHLVIIDVCAVVGSIKPCKMR